jgi:S-adenosylmethionine:tRNA ribosyltransferase-isomerase
VEIQYLTLHVGLGTFQPVRVSRLADIRLHAERYTLPAATAQAINRALAPSSGPPRRIVAAGTTTTRTLEHIAQQAHIAAQAPPGPLHLEPHSGSTSIFLAPGHRFRIVNGLLTNFHLPESTLLMLVAAFADCMDNGEPTTDAAPNRGLRTILAAYGHAIRHGYRFFSYGDCMLLL